MRPLPAVLDGTGQARFTSRSVAGAAYAHADIAVERVDE